MSKRAKDRLIIYMTARNESSQEHPGQWKRPEAIKCSIIHYSSYSHNIMNTSSGVLSSWWFYREKCWVTALDSRARWLPSTADWPSPRRLLPSIQQGTFRNTRKLQLFFRFSYGILELSTYNMVINSHISITANYYS